MSEDYRWVVGHLPCADRSPQGSTGPKDVASGVSIGVVFVTTA